MRGLLLTIVVLSLTACGMFQTPPVRNVNDGISAASASLESLQTTVHRMCGNTVAGGDCVDGSLVSTERKNQIKGDVSNALDDLQSALNLKAAGDSVSAADILTRVETYVLALQREIQRTTP